MAINGDAPPPRRPEERERNWPWFTIGFMALLLLGLLAFLALSGVLGAEKKEVPNVVGKQLIQAREQLERAGFDVRTERVRSQADFDEVLDQDPDGGEEADEGSTVTLEVSRGPGNVLVPSVANRPQEQAINELEDAGPEGERRNRGPPTTSRRAWPSGPRPGRASRWSRAAA